MWTSAVFVILLCATSQQLSAATTLAPAVQTSSITPLTPYTTPQPPPAVTTSAHEHVTRLLQEQLATLAGGTTTPQLPDVPPAPTLVPSTSAPEQDDQARAKQEDTSQTLVGQVLDGLVSLCERRLRSANAEAVQDLTSQITALVNSQRKFGTTVDGLTSRLDSIEQHLDSLVFRHRDLAEAVDVFKGETRQSMRELSEQFTHSQVMTTALQGNVSRLHGELSASLSQVAEKQNVLEQRVNVSITHTNQVISDNSVKQEQFQASITDLSKEFLPMKNKIDILESDLAASVDVFKDETRHSIRELSEQFTQSQLLTTALQGNVSRLQGELHTRLSQVDEKQNVVNQRVNVSITRTNQLVSDCSAKQEQSQASLTDLSKEFLAAKNDIEILESDSYSQNRTINTISSNQRGISERLNNLSALKTTFEVSLRNIISEQGILKTSIAQIQSAADTDSQQALRLLTEQGNLSNQLSAIQDKISLLPHYLGYQCESSSQCAEFVSNSTCGADGRCTCAAGFRQIAGSVTRCEPRRLGQSCSSTAQCPIPNAVCTSGVCACRSGHWNRDNQECRRNSRKDESCRYDGDCAAAGGTCIGGRCTCSSRTVGTYEYRLANGTSCMEGRVEMRRSGGSWGYVCDDYFKAASARVMCRSLGFAGGEALCCSKYGGSDNFHMDDVKCRGSESHLRDCPFYGWGRDDCSRSEVVSVRCD